jgi:outer membrane lipoprotein carrier protein
MAAVFCCAQQPGPSAHDLAQRVDGHYNQLHGLRAAFTETYEGLGVQRTESGILTLLKPGRMRWDYTTPAGKLFLLDGKAAISYTPGDAEATRIPEKQLDDLRSPLRFLLGHTELAKELDGLALAPATGQPGSYVLSGTPRGLGQRVRSIALTVDTTGAIRAMRIVEADGATTSFTFSDLRDNVPVSSADFTFTPPSGVTIIDGAAPI